MLPILTVLALSALPQSGEGKDKRIPVPTFLEREAAIGRLRRTLAADYARRRPQDRIGLARKLLALGRTTKDDPNLQFATFWEARRIASRSGDATTALGADAELASRYRLPLRSAEEERGFLAELSKAARDGEAARLLALGWCRLAEERIRTDDFKEAENAIRSCARLLPLAKSPALEEDVKRLRATVHRLKKAYRLIGEALAKLRQDPKDVAANLAVGKYLCFRKGEWAEGIAFLRKAGESPFRRVAELESTKAPPEKVGDAWRDLVGNLKNKEEIRTAIARAFRWYGAALVAARSLARLALEEKVSRLLGKGQLPREGIAFWVEPGRNGEPYLDFVSRGKPKINQGALGTGPPLPPRLDRTELWYPPSRQVRAVGPAGTIIAWVKVGVSDRVQTIVERGPGYLQDFALRIGKDRVAAWIRTVRGSTQAESKPALDSGVWVCAAMTWNGRRLAVFVNGIRHAEVLLDSPPRYNQDVIRIGKSTFEDAYLRGDLGSVLVYNRRLEEEEIWAAYDTYRKKMR